MELIPSLLLFLVWLAPPLPACQICLPFPAESLADHLIKADNVVLTRENPEKPFSLIATRALKGDGKLPAIDLYLDSHSRRLLKRDPSRSIVCAQVNNEWRRVATNDPVLHSIIVEIIAKSPDWKADPADRPDYFARYLDDPHPRIASLAHLEVARAPYSKIRTLAGAIPIDRLRAFLSDFRYAEWHALYILLLAQSEESIDQKRIIDAIRSNARHSISHQTAAWATAYIEIEETKAVDFLNRQYLGTQKRRPEEISTILAAYSVHGTNGHTHLRDAFVDAYRTLIDKHPEHLPAVVKDLTAWKRWELAEFVADRLASSPEAYDITATVGLRNYLRLAGESSTTESRPAASNRFLPWLLGGLLLLPLIFKLIGSRNAR